MVIDGSSDVGRLRLRIRGRVQGVWFRGSAKEQAEILGLIGWARNCSDGSVEILAQGPGAALRRFAAWCENGPAGARVTGVTAQVETVADELAGFRVRG